jgi:hypothetical protein
VAMVRYFLRLRDRFNVTRNISLKKLWPFFIKLPSILLIVCFVVALFLLLKGYDSSKKKNRVFSPLLIIYTLILFFILFDLVPITQELIPFEFRIAGYVGSICVFLYINMKVKKVLAAGKNEEK